MNMLRILLSLILLATSLAAQYSPVDPVFFPKKGLVRGGLVGGWDLRGGSGQSVANMVVGGAALQVGSTAGVDTNDPTRTTQAMLFDSVDDQLSTVPALGSAWTIGAYSGWPNSHYYAYDSNGRGWTDGAPSGARLGQPSTTRIYSTLGGYYQWGRVLNQREHRQNFAAFRGIMASTPIETKAANALTFGHSGTTAPSVKLAWTGGGTGTVDWGDGSATQTLTSSVFTAKTAAYAAGLGRVTLSYPSDAALTYVEFVNAGLVGTNPSMAANPVLTNYYIGDNQFSGTAPSMSANPALVAYSINSNQFTGTAPGMSVNPALVYYHIGSNQFTDYAGGGISSRVLNTFHAGTNALTATAVNAILADLRAAQLAGNVTCTVTLSGGTNAAPTGQGITDKSALIAAGWTVTTN